MKPVTDPDLIKRLENTAPSLVTDPEIIQRLEDSTAPAAVAKDIAQSGATGFNSGLVGAYDTFVQNPAIGLETLGRAALNALLGEGTVDPNPALKPFKQVTDRAGLTDYVPVSNAGQYAHAVGEGVGGAVPFAGAGLASAPIRAAVGGMGENLAVGAASGIGQQMDKDLGGSGVIGALAGGLAGAVGSSTAQKFANARAGVNQSETYRALTDAEVTPRLPGDATDSALARRLQSVVGGIGWKEVPEAAKRQADELSQFAEKIATKADPTASTVDDAGAALREGAAAYRDDWKAAASKRYADFEDTIPPDTPVSVANTRALFERGSELYPDAPQLGEAFSSPVFKRVRDGVMGALDNSGDDSLSWRTLASIRTNVGEELRKPVTSGEMNRRELNELYAALTNDMRAGAASVSDDAAKAFDDAADFYRQGAEATKGPLKNLLDDAKTDVDAYRFATGQMNAGAERLADLKSLMPKPQWDRFIASEVRRMGLAKAGQQSASGDVFSPATFLTNYTKLKQSGAADVLFESDMRSDLDKLAKATEAMKTSAKYWNHSNTESNSFWGRIISGGVGAGAGIYGGIGGAMLLAGSILGSKAGSYLMTRPSVVKFLATSADDSAMTSLGFLKGFTRLATQEAGFADPDVREELDSKIKQAVKYLSAPNADYLEKLSQYQQSKMNSARVPMDNQRIVETIRAQDPDFARELEGAMNSPGLFKGILYRALSNESRKTLAETALNINKNGM